MDSDTDLFDARILDSLSLMQLALALSEKNGIEIPPGAVERRTWRTIRSIVRFFSESGQRESHRDLHHVAHEYRKDDRHYKDPMPFLTEEKWVVPVAPGSFAYSGFFLRVFKGIERYMEELGRRHGATEVVYPPLWPIELFRKIRYADEFPQLMLLAAGVTDDAARHGVAAQKFNASTAPAIEIDRSFAASEHGLAPAVCDLCYWQLRNGTARNGSYSVGGPVFRNEHSETGTLDRLTGYFVRDVVFVGDETYVRAQRELLMQDAIELAKRLDLDCSIAMASDPFFGNSTTKNDMQRGEKLKYEIRARLEKSGRDLAVGSINYHLDFFGRAFNISLPSGGPIHSCCFGIGIDRLTYALFSQYGCDESSWPASVKDTLHLSRS